MTKRHFFKLTQAEIDAIVDLYVNHGVSRPALASRFCVSVDTIGRHLVRRGAVPKNGIGSDRTKRGYVRPHAVIFRG